MDPAFEIRKLNPSHVEELINSLETDEYWKRLMSIIPTNLQRFSYTCEVSSSNPHKYNSEHFRIIENASKRTKKPCTAILLDEWGTSGRVLPTLGHLLHLLTVAKLFRAADYIAIKLLNQPKPKRPAEGPEASISIELPKIQRENQVRGDEIETLLNEIAYPDSAVELIRRLNLQIPYKKDTSTIPKIVITPNDDDINTPEDSSLPGVTPKEESNTTQSDMIKFSTNSNESGKDSTNSKGNDFEQEAVVVNENFNSPESIEIPVISILLKSDTNLSYETNESTCSSTVSGIRMVINETNLDSSAQVEIPEISKLLKSEDSGNLPNFSLIAPSKELRNSVECFNQTLSQELSSQESVMSHVNIPVLSALGNFGTHNDSSKIYPSLNLVSGNLSNFHELETHSSYSSMEGNIRSDNIPDINDLRTIDSTITREEKVNKVSSSLDNYLPDLSAVYTLSTKSKNGSSNASSDSNRACNSPLPQLFLNTPLPHFNYNDLVILTNNFNEQLYIDDCAEGRFLGSGAFGSVFLALNLLDKPVAVKKLVLENDDCVEVDATVTKQFRNEVEVLSHYRHPNLLELIGYSCDGSTYCLLYEYIQGGALSVRLQATTNKLQWKQRLKIALGTADAIKYLHTAFSTSLIHRDIKSANILLDCSETPKLCDFGLIKLSPNQNTATATTVVGTSAYMAPEAFRGDISVEMDTFSFGVVLLELLTSLPPLDQNREGIDLVTHIGEKCDEFSISPLLDEGAGSWTENDISYDEELYKIANMCLEEKKKRPKMVFIRDLLCDLTKNV